MPQEGRGNLRPAIPGITGNGNSRSPLPSLEFCFRVSEFQMAPDGEPDFSVWSRDVVAFGSAGGRRTVDNSLCFHSLSFYHLVLTKRRNS